MMSLRWRMYKYVIQDATCKNDWTNNFSDKAIFHVLVSLHTFNYFQWEWVGRKSFIKIYCMLKRLACILSILRKTSLVMTTFKKTVKTGVEIGLVKKVCPKSGLSKHCVSYGNPWHIIKVIKQGINN